MSKKRWLLAAGTLVVVLAIAGGYGFRHSFRSGFVDGQRELTPDERAALTTAVESSLPTAAPARFVWFPLREGQEIYCALVNTSNVVGDHTEDLLFEVAFAPGNGGIDHVTSVYMPGADPGWRRIIQGNCAKAGYVAGTPGAASGR